MVVELELGYEYVSYTKLQKKERKRAFWFPCPRQVLVPKTTKRYAPGHRSFLRERDSPTPPWGT